MSLKSALYSHLKGDYGVTFTVNATTNVLTGSHTRSNGDKVRVASTTTIPSGLSTDTDYFVINVAGNDFKLSATSGGAEIDIVDTGTGTHSLGTSVTDQVLKRIYAGHAPHNVIAPYIVYKRVSENRNHTLLSPDGLVKTRIQFNAYAQDPVECENIIDSLRTILDGYDKAMGSLDVRLVLLDGVNDSFINPIHGDETGLSQVSIDFFFHYAETIPNH